MTVKAPGAGWRPIPGPADRETFFAAQARDRRASWKLAALCTLAVLLLAIPVAMVVSPLVVGVATLVFDAVNLVVPAPNVLDVVDRLAGDGSDAAVLIFYALMAVPGVLLVLPAWTAVRRLLARGGVGGTLLALGAREPRAGDLEEEQLANVVAEMGVAAGRRPPRLRLLDGPGLSAAAVGTGPDDATIIVSRGMLDRLDRDETQAIIGHLVASVGNGDLRIARLILSVHATLGLIEALTFVAVSPTVRARLGEVWRAARSRESGGAGAERACLLLLAGLVDESDDAFALANGTPRRSGPPSIPRHDDGRERTLRDRVGTVLVYPFVLTWMLLWLCRTAFLTLLTDPLTSLLWRRRRYLADASAVQLTRYPTGLARALASLAAAEAPLPGGPWASFLFAAGPRRRTGAGPVAGFGREKGDLGVDCLPDPWARIAGLRRMGAESPAPGGGRAGGLLVVWKVFFAGLVGFVWAASFVLCTVSVALGFFMVPLALMPIVGIPHLLLRYTVPWLLHR